MIARRTVGASALLCLLLTLYFAAASGAKEPQPQGHWYSPSRYNPMKLFRHWSTSPPEEQLANNPDLAAKLTSQLRAKGQLPPKIQLRDACENFRDLTSCVAALRVSHNLKIDFSCLKWDVTGIKPAPVSDSCAGPAGGRAMSLYRAIDLLKPEAEARHEASDAIQQARNEIKDASS